MSSTDFYSRDFWYSPWDALFGGKTVVMKDSVFSPEEYLHRGAVITSCAREKTLRRYCVKGELFKTLATKTAIQKKGYERMEYLCRSIANKVIHPICMEIVQKAKETGTYDFSPFEQMFNPSLGVKLRVETGGYGWKLIQGFCKHSAELVVVSSTDSSGKTVYFPLNDRITRRKSGKKYYLVAEGRKSMNYVGDLGWYFAKQVVLSSVLRYIKEMPEEDREENRIICYLKNALDRHIAICMKNGILTISEKLYENNDFVAYLEQCGVAYAVTQTGPAMMAAEEFYLMHGTIGADIQEDIRIAWDLFNMLIDEYEKDRNTEHFMRDLSDRATVWQTKKHITDKVVRAMQESSFNDYFGYVEFDEEVDIASMKELELEWKAIHAFFGQEKHEDIALRFRKLGNHHAAGLYFPTIRCLCVDIRYPSSMVHEYFHLMDFEGGCLSRKESFRMCEEIYTAELEGYMAALPENDALRKKWHGNTKYNRSYYLEPTEIFARCGEIYMVRVLGINNSLCQPEKGFAYPESEKLLEAVKLYFDKMFKREEEQRMAAQA